MPDDLPVCVRCNRPVEVSRDWYEVFERMHWICFHYEFEHEGDPDAPCADLGCPTRPDAAYPPEDDDHMRCRVCGLRQESPPWGRDGQSPTFDCCPCCGTEFGFQDATVERVRRTRKQWLASGAQWQEPSERPPAWKLERQLTRVPADWRDPPPP